MSNESDVSYNPEEVPVENSGDVIADTKSDLNLQKPPFLAKSTRRNGPEQHIYIDNPGEIVPTGDETNESKIIHSTLRRGDVHSHAPDGSHLHNREISKDKADYSPVKELRKLSKRLREKRKYSRDR